MAILLTSTWSAVQVSTDDVPRYLDAFVETLLYQRNQPHRLRFLLRRKEDMTVLQAAIPSLSKSDRWEAAVLSDLSDAKMTGRVLDGVRIVVWADNGREMSITGSGATLFKTIAAMEPRHLVYHSQMQMGGGSEAVREAVEELKCAPYEGKHEGLRCTVIESTPLFHLPVSKASTTEQIIFTLSSRHYSSSHSSLHSLAQSVVGIVLAGSSDAYPTYELVSRHHSFEGIGNVYFSGSSPRRRNTSSKSRVEGQKRIARQSEPKLGTRFAQDDKLHEAWLSFYPSTARSGRRPRLNLLSCVPCCSSSSGMMKSEDDDDNEEVCRTLVSPTSPPDSAETKIGVEDEKYGNVSIDSTEKLAPVETSRRGPTVPMSLAQAGRAVSTPSEGYAQVPGSPRRPEALTNVSFLRAGPWKLNLPEEVANGRAR